MYSKKTFWAFSAPTLIAFVIFMMIPTIIGMFYAFTDWNGVSYNDFVGLTNFSVAYKDDGFRDAFKFTLFVTIINVLFVNIIGFFLAMLVTRGLKGQNLFRSSYFLPNLIGGLILGFIWQFMFKEIFTTLGLPNLISEGGIKSVLAYVILTSWQMSGYVMVIYVAAIQNVPKDLIEAADVDGAKRSQILAYITWPMVAPAFTVSLFMTVSNSMKMFDQNLALTNGGPFNSTTMIALNIYKEAYTYHNFGLAQAKAIFFLIVVVTIALVQVSLTKKREVEL